MSIDGKHDGALARARRDCNCDRNRDDYLDSSTNVYHRANRVSYRATGHDHRCEANRSICSYSYSHSRVHADRATNSHAASNRYLPAHGHGYGGTNHRVGQGRTNPPLRGVGS